MPESPGECRDERGKYTPDGAYRLESVTCALCGEDASRPIMKAQDKNHGIVGEFCIVRCQQCGHVFTNPRPVSEMLMGLYPQNYGPHSQDSASSGGPHSWLSRSTEGVRKDVGRFYYFNSNRVGGGLRKLALLPLYLCTRVLGVVLIPNGTCGRNHALDIGCGIGQFLVELAAKDWEVHGVEPNPRAAAIAAGRLGGDVVAGTLESAAFADGSFDLVTMWHVLEHLPEPRRALLDVHRLLKANGWCIIAVPNIASLEFRVFRDNWLALDLPRHLHHFSARTLRALVKQTGLDPCFTTFQADPSTLWGSLCNLRGLGYSSRPSLRPGLTSFLLKTMSLVLALAHASGTMVIHARKPADSLA